MEAQEPSLRVRINHIDYTVNQAGVLDNTSHDRAPVIRIYGDSSIGRKTCVHVHQVYPYFFVEYTGKLNPDSVNRYIAKLTHSLNHAIAVSMKRNPHSPRSQFIRAILLVKGVHFYGFHSAYSPFLKVHIIDPTFVNRAVTLLQSGTIMHTRFRVYESHLSFILQFLSDFGLYGCGWIDLAEVWQRGQDLPQDDEYSVEDEEVSFRPSPYYRQTRMPLELDVAGHQILNRHRLSARNVHHKLSIPAPPLPSDPVVISVRELWEDERRRRAAKGLPPSPEIPRDLSARSRGAGGGWVQEARWWEQLHERIAKEREIEQLPHSPEEWERWVMTTFESIEAIWESRYRTWKPRKEKTSSEEEANPYETASLSDGSSQELGQPQTEKDVDVNEEMLSSQELSRLVEREEVQWAEGQGDRQEDDRPEAEGEAVEDAEAAGLQYGEHSPQRPPATSSKQILEDTTPQPSPSGRSQPFRDIWSKLAGPRASLPSVKTATSPTKSQQREQEPSTPSPAGSPRGLGEAVITSTVIAPTLGPVEDRSAENPFLDRDEGIIIQDNLEVPRRQNVAFAEPIMDTPSHSSGEESHSAQEHEQAGALQEVEYSTDSESEQRAQKRRKIGHDGTQIPTTLEPTLKIPGTPFPRLTLSASTKTSSYVYAPKPPKAEDLRMTTDMYDIPSKIYQAPYYSLDNDAPLRPREFAGLVFNLKGGTGVKNLQQWVPEENTPFDAPSRGSSLDIYGWEYAGLPPGRREVQRWLEKNKMTFLSQKKKSSQIAGPTQANGAKISPIIQAPTTRERGNMTVLSLEVLAPSSGQGLPDPDKDPIVAVFYSYYDSNFQRVDHDTPFTCESGIIALDNAELNTPRLRNWTIDTVDSELDLLNRVVDIVQAFDPDIVTGWEVQSASWGYLNARARYFEVDLVDQISRAPGRPGGGATDQWGLKTTSTFKLIGRHVLNLWRIMRSEHSLTSYTLENVVFQVLRRRIPRYSASTLTKWYNSNVPEHTSRVFSYFASRTSITLELVEVAEVVTKNAEFARVFGVDFFSVISRGSQFKVESFMFRIAKPESFVLLSPSKEDVGKQNAAECMPLIMEPLSAFYSSPLLVLDFQSLYPSIMIAYNYCYSTCLGRVTEFKGQNKFGVTDLHQPPGLLETLKDHINISANGMIFVKPHVRKGLLGRMLTELLDTRVMIKTAMKTVKDDKALRRVLDARQLAMKFIANVTYGYTSATFSGRMPAVEIADAIVQSGRETLEKAIKTIDSTQRWGARVVYGDTDSLFIYLKGKTKDQAFRIGQDIADTITAMNPAPVKLKFEKVYLPCVLLAKKRYVGFKYENPDDKEPVFDAKGIETVRRDGVPAQQKMTETCLKILFRTQDLSKVKEYCCSTWTQILDNKASVQDFIFAKEVRLGTYSDKAPPPPGVAVAARRMLEDPNDEPQYGDRIPYVIARGPPGTRLVDRAVAPDVLLRDSSKHLDGMYYISRVLIPPLERVFNLVGADVKSWYDEMPKPLRADEADSLTMTPRKLKQQAIFAGRAKIEEHFYGSRCLACNSPASYSICDDCRLSPQETISSLLTRVHRTETRLTNAHLVCVSCSGAASAEPVACESLDCPWLYERKKLEQKAEQLDHICELVEEIAGHDEEPDGGEGLDSSDEQIAGADRATPIYLSPNS
ncbi:hypothetical protein BDW22DRAFT_1350202 [Trametopsis cervina]|nr:hypothetical protein BDW22DRAFT_1350202 [Trametopsis cervina]